MNICLVIPPSPFLLDEKVFVSLGVLKVAASLRLAGHAIDVLDLSGLATTYLAVLGQYQTTHTPGLYGITATSPQMPAAMQINERITEWFYGDSCVILGGPHATLVHAAARNERKAGREGRATIALKHLTGRFCAVVAGDGERSVHRALSCQGGAVIDADDPTNDLFLSSTAYAESPLPARDLIDLGSYHYWIDGERATSIISQLGCPFGCQFCAGRNSAMLRRVRSRPPENVVAEIVDLHERYGYKGFMFLDDELNVNRQMLTLMKLLADEAKRRGIHWKFRGFLKAELFTEEQAAAMAAGGFKEVLIGFEAAHDRILSNINKNATLADNTRAVAIARKAGIGVKALMSLGHPGESEETVRAVRNWLLEVRPADFDCTIITPYPGCNYYDHAVRESECYAYRAPKTNDVLFMDDVDFTQEPQYYKGKPGDYVSHVWTPQVSKAQLVELRDWVEEDVRKRLGIPYYSERVRTPQ